MRPEARRELGAAVVGCLVGAAAVLLAGGPSWADVEYALSDDFPVVAGELSARTAAPLAVALGLLALAGAVALVATRGRPRQVVGAVLVVAGGLIGLDAGRAFGRFAALAADAGPPGTVATVSASWWPWLAVAGGLLIAAAGALTVVRGGRWAGMSQRYEAPGAGRTTSTGPAPSQDQDAAWRALDRGEDPTV